MPIRPVMTTLSASLAAISAACWCHRRGERFEGAIEVIKLNDRPALPGGRHVWRHGRSIVVVA